MSINDQNLKKIVNTILDRVDNLLKRHNSLKICTINDPNFAILVDQYRNIADDLKQNFEKYIHTYQLLNQHQQLQQNFQTQNHQLLPHQIRFQILDNHHILLCINHKISDQILTNLAQAYHFDNQKSAKPKLNKTQIQKRFYIQCSIATVLCLLLSIAFCTINMHTHNLFIITSISVGLVVAIVAAIRANMLQKSYLKLMKQTKHKPTINRKLTQMIDHLNQSFDAYMKTKLN